MADIFARTDAVPAFFPVAGCVVGDYGKLSDPDANVLTIHPDGKSELKIGKLAKQANENGGLLIQKFTMSQHDLVPFVNTVLFGPTVVDLRLVEDKVRKALGLAPDQPLMITTVEVAATGSGRESLTVNGVPVPLE